jgi:hypothetical protein
VECQRPSILRGLLAVFGSGDRQDRIVLDQPAQGHLRRGLAVTLADLSEQRGDRLERRQAPAAERLENRRSPRRRLVGVYLPVSAPLASGW